VLVDRGLREYPIQADWVGMKIPTVIQETVRVELVEMGLSDDRVVVYTREA
jgi:pyrimidine operon attenuation protein/uracil phosphoribosyltransferase